MKQKGSLIEKLLRYLFTCYHQNIAITTSKNWETHECVRRIFIIFHLEEKITRRKTITLVSPLITYSVFKRVAIWTLVSEKHKTGYISSDYCNSSPREALRNEIVFYNDYCQLVQKSSLVLVS